MSFELRIDRKYIQCIVSRNQSSDAYYLFFAAFSGSMALTNRG